MSRKEKAGKIFYWFFLIVYTAALSAVVFAALNLLWDFAQVYESSIPDPVIDAYIANLQNNILDEGVVETLANMPHEYQSDEEVRQIVKEMFSGEIKASETDSKDPETKVYLLYCDSNCFGKVYLTKDRTKKAAYSVYGYDLPLPFDLRPWLVGGEEFDFNGLYSTVTVTAPDNYTVQLNGKTLTADYIVEKDIMFDCLRDYYDVGTNLPRKVKYRFENVIGRLEPVVYDSSGNVFTVDPDKDDSQYIKGCSAEEQARLNAFCQSFTYEYLKYISGLTKAGSYWTLAEYLLPGSDLDSRMQNAQDGLGWAHTTSFNLDSYQMTGAIELGGGYYVCSIVADTTTYTTGKGEVKNTSELKVLVIDSGSAIKAVSMR